jgi:hypothetical protein
MSKLGSDDPFVAVVLDGVADEAFREMIAIASSVSMKLIPSSRAVFRMASASLWV